MARYNQLWLLIYYWNLLSKKNNNSCFIISKHLIDRYYFSNIKKIKKLRIKVIRIQKDEDIYKLFIQMCLYE